MCNGGGNILGNDFRPAIDASSRDVKLGGFSHKLSGLQASPERNLLDLNKLGSCLNSLGSCWLFFRSLGNSRAAQRQDSQYHDHVFHMVPHTNLRLIRHTTLRVIRPLRSDAGGELLCYQCSSAYLAAESSFASSWLKFCQHPKPRLNHWRLIGLSSLSPAEESCQQVLKSRTRPASLCTAARCQIQHLTLSCPLPRFLGKRICYSVLFARYRSRTKAAVLKTSATTTTTTFAS
jgi:hypothetical protein